MARLSVPFLWIFVVIRHRGALSRLAAGPSVRHRDRGAHHVVDSKSNQARPCPTTAAASPGLARVDCLLVRVVRAVDDDAFHLPVSAAARAPVRSAAGVSAALVRTIALDARRNGRDCGTEHSALSALVA